MDREALFRRAVHLSMPVFLVYYLVPVEEWVGVAREVILVVVFLGFLGFETGRRSAGWRIYGMRDYEVRGAPAYIWAGAGLTASFLFFPIQAVVPTVMGVSLVDPLCGFLRDRKSAFYPSFPWAVWALVTLVALSRLASWEYLMALGASFAVAAVAVAVEWPTIKNVDDDFLMLVVPGFVLAVAVAMLGP